ncbi:MAG: hypothetical protein ABIJ42_08395 [Acidobacteriota bacterium]
MKGVISRMLNTAYVIPSCIWERRMPWAPRAFLRALQQVRFRIMVNHAWKHVPFYRNVMEERGISPADLRKPEDLKLLPLISNEEFRKDPSIFNSEKINIEDDMLMCAGNYKKIIWSRKAALQWFARISRSRAVVNNLLGKHSGYVEAYVQPKEDCNHTMNKFWGENLLFRGRTAGRYRLNINEPYTETLKRLNEIRPDIIYCYGSHTEQFFKYIHNNKLDLEAPRIWIYGSDMMSPGMRDFIEKQYGCLVYSGYSMNEMGAFSFECENRNGFHLNIDACYSRIANELGETVPDGTAGEVVISNLVNKATVILNYRTGDWARMGREPCVCGRTLPLLQELRGRICDTLYCANGTDVSYSLLAAPCGEILARVRNFQIVQERRGHICWTLIPFPDTDLDATAARLAGLTGSIIPPPNIVEVKWVEDIELTPGRKRTFVIRRFEE